MGNYSYVLSTVFGIWVLSVGLPGTASPGQGSPPERLQPTADSMAAYRAIHPGAHGGKPAMAHQPQREKSRRAAPGIARTPGEQPRISLPAGKKN